jgi:antitoxin component of MazEF toxin-antitoxin module
MGIANMVIDQTVKEWTQGLGLHIPASLARAAGIERGTPVRMELTADGFIVRAAGRPRLPLPHEFLSLERVAARQ